MKSDRVWWESLLRRLEADLSRTPSERRDRVAWVMLERRIRRLSDLLLRQFRQTTSPELDDLVQDVLLKLQSPALLRRLSAAGSAEGYLVVLIRNTVIDRIRRGRLELRRLREAHLERPTSSAAVEDLIALRQQLEELSEEEQELLRLRFWERMTIRDVADKLGVRYSTASVRLFRLLKKLGERLKP